MSLLGHGFASLVLALLQVRGSTAKEAVELLDRTRQLKGKFHCYDINCPEHYSRFKSDGV